MVDPYLASPVGPWDLQITVHPYQVEELQIIYLPLPDLEIIIMLEMEWSRVNPDQVEVNGYFTAWLKEVKMGTVLEEGVDIVVGDRVNLQLLPIVGIGKKERPQKYSTSSCWLFLASRNNIIIRPNIGIL